MWFASSCNGTPSPTTFSIFKVPKRREETLSSTSPKFEGLTWALYLFSLLHLRRSHHIYLPTDMFCTSRRHWSLRNYHSNLLYTLFLLPVLIFTLPLFPSCSVHRQLGELHWGEYFDSFRQEIFSSFYTSSSLPSNRRRGYGELEKMAQSSQGNIFRCEGWKGVM